MEGEREYSPPFWSQPQRRPSPSPPSSGLRPWALVLLSSVFIILFLPAFLSSSVRGLRPAGSLIKNGWDTLNLCLVLFAILCGLLGRNNDDDDDDDDDADKSPRPTEWPAVGYSAPPPVQNSYGDPPVASMVGSRRMRSSSSYPDLRQEALEAWGGAAEAWRFSDDIQLYHRSRRSEVGAKTIPVGSAEGWRFSDDVQLYHRGQRSENNHRGWESTPEAESKTIPVDTFVLRKSPPRCRSPPPTPPPPPPPPQRHSRRRSVHKLPEKEVEPEVKMEEEKPQPPSPAPPPPPPPPPPATHEQKRSHKKTSAGRAKDIAIALFYNKKRTKGSKTNKKFHDDTSPPANAAASPHTPQPPPPPPPPPPPSSVFYQLFSHKKVGSKNRRIYSTPAPPPPPPPPPPPSTVKRRSKRNASSPPPPPPPPPTQKSRKQVSRSPPPPPPPPPPAPPQVNRYKTREKSNLSGFSLPPSSSLPPPPPPPLPPPPSDLQLLFSEEEISVDGILGEAGMGSEEMEEKEGVAAFCPSPDVNNKADLFIARFRAGLKLEKLNSLREKQRRQQQEQQQEEEFMMV